MNLRQAPLVRRGFSLLEVLCTLALTAVLLSALAGAMSLYSSLLAHSADTVQSKSVALALFSRFSADARACIVPPPETSTAISVGSLADLLRATPTREQPLRKRGSSRAATLVGDAESVRFLTLPAESGRTADDGGPHWVAFGTAPALARHFPASSPDGRTGSGLERWSQDGRGEVSRQLLAGNVSEIRLRYWDGLRWHQVWPVGDDRDLPVALELTLGLSSQAGAEDMNERYTTIVPLATHSHNSSRHSQPAISLQETRP